MKIRIVCTCGGTLDDPWRLGYILEVMDRSPVGRGCEPMRDQHRRITGYRLRCGRCPRAPEFTVDRWALLVTGYDAAGRDTLDISALPF